MTDWQPIETAPRDGAEVLLYGNWAGEITGIEPRHVILIGRFHNDGADYPGYDWDVSGTDYYSAWMRATHWMPLPEPPNTAKPIPAEE